MKDDKDPKHDKPEHEDPPVVQPLGDINSPGADPPPDPPDEDEDGDG